MSPAGTAGITMMRTSCVVPIVSGRSTLPWYSTMKRTGTFPNCAV